jgi:ubiquinone biosynthesis monooxygenase Coq6
MSAVDKLHKLYSSAAPPIVWARSTGVEVFNELDGLKAGIIGAAGGQTESGAHNGGPASAIWGTVASGVEALVGGTRVAGAVENGLRTAAGGVLQQLVRAVSAGGPGRKSTNDR